MVRQLAKSNVVAQAIHGDKSQGARQRALNDFKDKKLRVLVATDIAARGIDIDELACVVNYDLPDVPETYVHRIGRTGRAGLEGIAISFCDFDEKAQLADIEKLIGKKLTEVADHPYPLQNNFPSVKATQPKRGGGKSADQAGAAQGPAKKKEKKAVPGTVESGERLSKKSQSTGARTPKKSRPSEAPLSKKTSSQGSSSSKRPPAPAAPTAKPASTPKPTPPQSTQPQPTPSPQKRRRNPFSGLLRKPGGGFR